MGQYRIQRLNDQLRDEISKLILRGDVKDPRVNTFLSINRVEVTQDLSYGKVFVSSFLTDGDVKLGVDGLNLLGINNVNSYYWITDVTNQQYAVPNYLTGRQINARITVEF